MTKGTEMKQKRNKSTKKGIKNTEKSLARAVNYY